MEKYYVLREPIIYFLSMFECINKSHTISWLLESCYNKGILMGHIVKER